MTDPPQSWRSGILKTTFCGANEIITITVIFTNMDASFKHACFNSSFNKHHHLWEVNLENSQFWTSKDVSPVLPSRGGSYPFAVSLGNVCASNPDGLD